MRLNTTIIIIFFMTFLFSWSQDLKTAPIEIEWATYYGSKDWDQISDLEIDSQDNVYFTCDRLGVKNGKDVDAVILGKLSPDCKMLWEVKLNDTRNSNICMDKEDNVIVGTTRQLEKYSPQGELLWKFEHPDITPPFTYLQCDSKGNIYGRYNNTCLCQIFKIDKDGNILWDREVGDGVSILVLDSNDDLIVLGSKRRSGESSTNYYLLDGENGDIIFKKPLFDCEVRWITIDSKDNIIFAGSDYRKNLEFTAKIDKSGSIVFIKYPKGYFYPDVIPLTQHNYLEVDQFDNIYNLVLITPNIDKTHLYDAWILKFSESGKILWEYIFGGTGREDQYIIKYKPPNTLYIGGCTQSYSGLVYGDAYQKKLAKSKPKYFGNSTDGYIAKFRVEALYLDIVNIELTHSIDTLYLDDICLNDTNVKDVAIKNYSDTSINLKPPVFADPDRFAGEYLRGSFLEWNDTLGLRIYIAPTDTGHIETMLYIYCEEAERIMDSVLIIARVVEPELTIEGENEFGFVKMYQIPVNTLIVRNTGTSKILLNEFEDLYYPFSLYYTEPELPALLEPGDSIIVKVKFYATEEGTFTDSLTALTKKLPTTCVTTAEAILKGISVEYEVNPEDIDYGIIADCETPIDTACVANYGQSPVTITEAAVLSNTDDFEILHEPPVGTVLRFLDTVMYIVRFTPQLPEGTKNGEIVVETSHPEEPRFKIHLTGTSETVNVTAEDVNFGETGIRLDRSRNSKVICHNSFPVHIADVIENEDWLEISPNEFTLQAGEDIDLDISIRLDEAKPFSTNAQIIIDDPCPDTVAFRIEAVGIKSSVEVTPVLDYQETEFCYQKTMDIIIRNTGKLPVELLSQRIEGSDKNVFNFTGTWENIIIEPDSTFTEPVIFDPGSSSNGLKTAQAISVILMDTEEREFTTDLTGERYEIHYEMPEDIHLSTRIKEPVDSLIELINTGKHQFTIEEINFSSGEKFSINPDPTGQSLGSGGSTHFSIILYSDKPGIFEDGIHIRMESDYCIYLDTIELSGKVYMDILSWLPDTSGSIGDVDFRVPLRIISYSDTPLTNMSYTAEISFDASVYKVDKITQGTLAGNIISGGEQKLVITDNGITVARGETELTELSGMLLLSDSATRPLQIDSFTWDHPLIESRVRDGSIKATGVCVQDLRLILPYTPTAMQISPNPAEDEASITIQSEEEGAFELSIYTIEGVRKEYHNWTQNTDETSRNIILDLKDWLVGVYPAILRTPGKVITGMVYVVR